MATTSLWSVKGWLGKVVVYVEDPEKTENPAFYGDAGLTGQQGQSLEDVISYAVNERKTTDPGETVCKAREGGDVKQRFVSGINCSPLTAREEMMAVKKRFGKDNGVMAYHGYQSFAPGEASPETAHEIGVRLAERLWGDRYQVLVATHLDKESHLHNHFVVNSVSFLDGLRYYRSEKDYYAMRRESDRLCLKYGLSVLPPDAERGRSRQYGEWRAEKEERPTFRGLIKSDIDEAVHMARTDREFFLLLRQKGYDIKFGSDITVRPPGKERGMKLARNFGPEYTREAICRRILEHPVRKQEGPVLSSRQGARHARLLGKRKNAKRVGGLRGLYLYYCYCLGIIHTRERPGMSERARFLLREDLIKMEQISRETRFLCTRCIDTAEELGACKKDLEIQMRELCKARGHLRSRNRREPDDGKREACKEEIREMTRRIRKLRGELTLCDGIARRSGIMKETLGILHEEEQKEGKEHEHRGRGGRAGC